MLAYFPGARMCSTVSPMGQGSCMPNPVSISVRRLDIWCCIWPVSVCQASLSMVCAQFCLCLLLHLVPEVDTNMGCHAAVGLASSPNILFFAAM